MTIANRLICSVKVLEYLSHNVMTVLLLQVPTSAI